MAKTAVVIYEIGQLGSLMRFLSSISAGERETVMVVAIGANIEYALEDAKISFVSARGLRSLSSVDRISYSEELGRAIFDHSSLSFFSHRGISLDSLFRISLQDYLAFFSYYIDIFTSLLEQHSVDRLIIFAPTVPVLSTSNVTAPFEAQVVVDAARTVCDQAGIVYLCSGGKSFLDRVHTSVAELSFGIKRMLFGAVLSVSNVVQSFRPPRKIRILASEYWTNIAPLLEHLPESELVLMDRLEARKAGLRAILRHRMRFMHIAHFISSRIRKESSEKAGAFVRNWHTARKENVPLQTAVFRGNSLTAQLERLMEHIVSVGGRRAVQDIDGAHRMFRAVRPEVVLVRASASAQIHFPILCFVARSLGIPSLEIQHGVRYVGPGSFSSSHAAEYMAVYGPAVVDQMKGVGYTDDKLFSVGSPRFDSYLAKTDVQHERLTLACIAPAVVPGFWDDTYDAIDYFQSIAHGTASLPTVSINVKLRGSASTAFFEEVLRRSFGKRTYRVFSAEPLQDVLASSDVVITPFSTALLESLLMHKPTLFVAALPAYAVYGGEFVAYADTGALSLARSEAEVAGAIATLVQDPAQRDRLRRGARTCMERNYAFDGKASKRLAETIRLLAARSDTR